MSFNRANLNEALLANFALVPLIARVRAHVVRVAGALGKFASANGAHVRLLARVESLVRLEIARCREELATRPTRILFCPTLPFFLHLFGRCGGAERRRRLRCSRKLKNKSSQLPATAKSRLRKEKRRVRP